ncbi:MAG: tripartite tricarboxylate transporter substrate binding protein [Betaproteobacteria bacterium]|nr:tripartite tricarboxylate transporter substrate binding protein [Betaproteobacteria bacterium]
MKRHALPLLLALVPLLAAPAALAQSWPTKQVSLIIPSAPGGPSDVLGRVLADKLRERYAQPFVVENRGGAGGNLGTAAVARAAGDGYTLLITVDAPIVVNPALYASMPYDPIKDLQPVAMIGDGGDVALAVPDSSPAKTLQELIALMRKDPSKANYVSSGNGFPSHIVGELFKREAKFDAQHIPAKGAGAAMQELLSGRMNFSFPPASLAAPAARSGRIRVLAVSADKRNALLPDTPTFAELGLPTVTLRPYWITLFTTAGAPRAMVESLGAEVRRITHTPEFGALLSRQGMFASQATPDALAERMKRDLASWKAIIQPLGVKAD